MYTNADILFFGDMENLISNISTNFKHYMITGQRSDLKTPVTSIMNFSGIGMSIILKFMIKILN